MMAQEAKQIKRDYSVIPCTNWWDLHSNFSPLIKAYGWSINNCTTISPSFFSAVMLFNNEFQSTVNPNFSNIVRNGTYQGTPSTIIGLHSNAS